jgi:hypothetical protein
MSMFKAYHVTRAESLADDQAQELDRIIGRITRNDPILTVQDEGGKHWIVVDLANDPDAVMLRTPSTDVVARFVKAFLAKHPEATFKASGEPERGSDRPTGGTLPAATTGTVSQAVPHDEPASLGFSVRVGDVEGRWRWVDGSGTTAPPPPSNVVPIRQGIAS